MNTQCSHFDQMCHFLLQNEYIVLHSYYNVEMMLNTRIFPLEYLEKAPRDHTFVSVFSWY